MNSNKFGFCWCILYTKGTIHLGMQLAVHVAVLFPFYFYRVGAFLSVPQPYSFIFSGAVRFPIHIPRQSGTTMATSYDTDSDDSDKLQRQRGTSLGSSSETSGSRMFPGDSSATRYDDLIADVGLEGKLKHAGDLPPQHAISCYDIFCNRELKQEKLAAVGFDMDYTLAQYHQPVFDKLGFDGAKEKLVHKFGYPKEALDFEYDHSVRISQEGSTSQRQSENTLSITASTK